MKLSSFPFVMPFSCVLVTLITACAHPYNHDAYLSPHTHQIHQGHHGHQNHDNHHDLQLAQPHDHQGARAQHSSACLTETAVGKVLPQLEKVVEGAFAPQEAPPTVLTEDKCWKRRYSKGTYELVIYRETENPDEAKGIAGKPVDPEQSQKCLERGLVESKKLNLSFVDRILEKDKILNAKFWDDPHLGPVRWLACGLTNQIQFNDSVATMIHELSHGIKTENCLFLSTEEENICFNFPPDLPKRSLAKLSSIPSNDPRAIAGIKFFEDLYLDRADGSFFLLLDEIQAYTTTTTIYRRQLEMEGRSALYEKDDKSGARAYIALPQMMNYGVLYLKRLKEQNPSLYKKIISDKKNVTNLKKVLRLAESTYKSWEKINLSLGGNTKPSEAAFWQLYLEHKLQVLN